MRSLPKKLTTTLYSFKLFPKPYTFHQTSLRLCCFPVLLLLCLTFTLSTRFAPLITFCSQHFTLQQHLSQQQEQTQENHNLLRRPNRPTPSWCPRLLKHPKKLIGSACRVGGPTDDDNCGKGLAPIFPGQKGVDYFLWTQHYRLEEWTKNKTNKMDNKNENKKIYVDLATNHAVRISNTYIMDRCLEWNGICIEPNEMYFHEIYQLRSCYFLPLCISDRFEKVKFITGKAQGLSGIETTNKNLMALNLMNKSSHAYRYAYSQLHDRSVVLNCITLTSLFNDLNVTHVDYLNLDVEGHELKVLKGVDWNQVVIDIIGVEARRNSKVLLFLQELGYRKIKEWISDGEDWLYVRKGFKFGKDAYPDAAKFFGISA